MADQQSARRLETVNSIEWTISANVDGALRLGLNAPDLLAKVHAATHLYDSLKLRKGRGRDDEPAPESKDFLAAIEAEGDEED